LTAGQLLRRFRRHFRCRAAKSSSSGPPGRLQSLSSPRRELVLGYPRHAFPIAVSCLPRCSVGLPPEAFPLLNKQKSLFPRLTRRLPICFASCHHAVTSRQTLCGQFRRSGPSASAGIVISSHPLKEDSGRSGKVVGESASFAHVGSANYLRVEWLCGINRQMNCSPPTTCNGPVFLHRALVLTMERSIDGATSRKLGRRAEWEV
jgi:hypothetical protein